MRRFAGVSALRELRALACLLESRLAPLLRAGVSRQEAAPLEVAAELGIDLGERPGDSVANRSSLAGDAAAVDADADVHLALVSGGQERLANEGLVLVAWEVILEAARVDLELAGARSQDHPGDRGLALAGGLDARFAVQLHGGLASGGGLLARLSRGLGLGPGPLLGLGLQASALLGAQLALGLDRDRLELGTRRHILGGLLRPLLGLGRLCLVLGRLCLGPRLLRLALGLRCPDLGLSGLILFLRCLGVALGCGLLRRFGLLGRLVLLLLVLAVFFVRHHALTSICLGCWASWGCCGPA